MVVFGDLPAFNKHFIYASMRSQNKGILPVNRIEKLRRDRTEVRKRTLDEAFCLLSARFSPIGVAMKPFGSYAEGKIHAGSDLDLAIPGPDLPSDVRRAVIKEAERISAELGVGIDLVFEAESPLFFEEVRHAYPV